MTNNELTEVVAFRINKDDYDKLHIKAIKKKTTVGKFARDFILKYCIRKYKEAKQ